MYDPKFRFAILMSIFMVLAVGASLIKTYIFDGNTLDLAAYVSGVIRVGGATLGGFIFVWVCTKIITFDKYKKTGFEATFRDETGTGFNFPVSLNKFLPDVIAAPVAPNIHPVEAEIIGFLNGFKNFPLSAEDPNGKKLYDNSILQWRAMQQIPGTTELHRIVALAQDLGLVNVYKEKRTTYPLTQFWLKDKVRYERRCEFHGGYSASVLSTMPSFNAMPERTRRAILIAVRYRDNPVMIPANCDPIAFELYEALHRAEHKAKEIERGQQTSFAPTELQVAQFNAEVAAFFQAAVRSMEINPANALSQNDGVYLNDGVMLIQMGPFMQNFAALLTPETRDAFNLWDVPLSEHPSWPYMVQALRAIEVLQDSWEDVKSTDGIFQFNANETPFENAFLVKITNARFPDLRASLDNLPRWQGYVSVTQDGNQLMNEVEVKAQRIDTLLQQLHATQPV